MHDSRHKEERKGERENMRHFGGKVPSWSGQGHSRQPKESEEDFAGRINKNKRI